MRDEGAAASGAMGLRSVPRPGTRVEHAWVVYGLALCAWVRPVPLDASWGPWKPLLRRCERGADVLIWYQILVLLGGWAGGATASIAAITWSTWVGDAALRGLWGAPCLAAAMLSAGIAIAPLVQPASLADRLGFYDRR